MGESTRLTERELARIWSQGLAGDRFRTTEGQPLEVLHPGWPNVDRGPDFKDALLTLDGQEIGGDIEVHVHPEDWRAHGHHRNPGYNGVILQVVWQGEAAAPIHLQNGGLAPVLALEPWAADSLEGLENPALAPVQPTCPVLLNFRDGDELAALLDRLGRQRFLEKAQRFEATLAAVEPEQALYEGVMGALGYAKNQSPLRELARRMPLAGLMRSAGSGQCEGQGTFALEALLLGGAGLLPSQRRSHRGGEEPYAALLEGLWRGYDHEAVLAESDWCFFRVRPDNLPGRRLAAAARLLHRYRDTGLLEGLRRSLAAGSPRAIESALTVASDGYWAEHRDFGLPARAPLPALLGRGRAAEVAVNIILPFFWAFAGRASPSDGVDRDGIMALYSSYPGTGDNHITRRMAEMLRGKARPPSTPARRQQALIHLYQQFCTLHRCSSCPLAGEGRSP